MTGKTILILAASYYQLDAIETARRLGYRVVTTDNVPDNPGHALADAHYDVDVTDREAVLDLARREGAAGILAVATDVAVPSRAYVAERLGLPGPPVLAAETVCNKVRLRALLLEQGLPAPETHVLRDARDVADGWFGRGAWIVKPDASSGAKGVRIVASAEACLGHLPEALGFSPTRTALLECFLVGHQGTCEGVVRDGEIAAAFFLDRQTAAPPFVTTTGHRVPTTLPAGAQAEVLRQLGVIWRALGVRDEVFDCDFVATDDGVFILDLSPRIGGNSIVRLLREAADLDLVAYAIRRACGDPAGLAARPELRPCGLVIFGSDRAGRLGYDADAVAALATEPWVRHLALDAAPGARVEPFVNSRHRIGEALVVGESRAAVEGRVRALHERLAIRVT